MEWLFVHNTVIRKLGFSVQKSKVLPLKTFNIKTGPQLSLVVRVVLSVELDCMFLFIVTGGGYKCFTEIFICMEIVEDLEVVYCLVLNLGGGECYDINYCGMIAICDALTFVKYMGQLNHELSCQRLQMSYIVHVCNILNCVIYSTKMKTLHFYNTNS